MPNENWGPFSTSAKMSYKYITRYCNSDLTVNTCFLFQNVAGLLAAGAAGTTVKFQGNGDDFKPKSRGLVILWHLRIKRFTPVRLRKHFIGCLNFSHCNLQIKWLSNETECRCSGFDLTKCMCLSRLNHTRNPLDRNRLYSYKKSMNSHIQNPS